ncbi:plastocyanin/azurin family copper-binding protein [Streptomyces gilvifuscus]|uniref:Plastocyanin/azurin family copper-binding protein n=1 Tax=Streptomyces gilvifuscus TaxID=1550617 RepID=A0ABT5FWF6_9ACTN|nr:plastocyanin/azurin family copper-binding protein [Streptomyces gilvifuscus]MDC2956832.1 plastocyanin/azurin family copper-binding protein [Streptomyces gilvifuscus]
MPPRLTLRIPRALLAALLLTAALTFLPAPAAQAAGHQIVMSGYAFGPRSLTIMAGDTVTWVNHDTAPHDVKTVSGPASFHSPMLNKGGTWSYAFTTAGTYGYICTVHPGMTAQIVVRAAATRAPAPSPTSHHDTPMMPGPSSAHTPSPASAAPAHHSATAAAPAASDSPTASAVPAAAAQPEATPAAQPAGATRPLDPLLVLAGIVAGVAVLCLLLVGSRSAAAATAASGDVEED